MASSQDYNWRQILVAVRVRPLYMFLITVVGQDWT